LIVDLVQVSADEFFPPAITAAERHPASAVAEFEPPAACGTAQRLFFRLLIHGDILAGCQENLSTRPTCSLI
jgi:hypothetical protein